MSNAVEQEPMKVERKQSSVKNKGRLVFSDCGIIGFDWDSGNEQCWRVDILQVSCY